MADLQRNNQLLKRAITEYEHYIAMHDHISNDTEYQIVAERCIERMRFIGKKKTTQLSGTIRIHLKLFFVLLIFIETAIEYW